MITSTRSDYPNMKVVKDLGLIYGIDDKMRMIRTIAEIDVYMKQAVQDLEKQAAKLGANAVLGISFALAEKTLPMVMGSAVILEDID